MNANVINPAALTIKSIAASVAAQYSAKWTGAMVLRTIAAEDAELDHDIERMYFQFDLDGKGDLLWVDENGLDEVENEDMKQYI